MSPRLPVVSGLELIKWLESLGYRVVSQRGSHIKLVLKKNDEEHFIIVPNHPEIAKGTLNDILNAVSRHTGIPKKKLRELLR